MSYQAVAGLEVHVQLNTKTKIFCSCSTDYSGAQPNTHVCPICLGHPGVMPVLNKSVFEAALRTCLALNCEVPSISKFDRKHYFYPDLCKAYQISQYDLPIGSNGGLWIYPQGLDKEGRLIRINRIHMEEDAGKLVHMSSQSGVDYNRAGIPLLEIVTEPDIKNSTEARAYLQALRQVLLYLQVSDCDMENGSLRCDLNVSVHQPSEPLGTRVEVKNMNSFRSVSKAMEYEIDRQIHSLENGETIIQCTRLWDDDREETRMMRSKEDAQDYRYFPEPDLPPLSISSEKIQKVKKGLPELPIERYERYMKEGLSAYQAEILCSRLELAPYYEDAFEKKVGVKLGGNFVITELAGALKNLDSAKLELLSTEEFSSLLKLVEDGKVSQNGAKEALGELLTSGGSALEVVQRKNLLQISDDSAIEAMVLEVLEADSSAKALADLREGKGKAIGALVGQVMKKSKGQANPKVVNQLLRDLLAKNYGIEL